MDSNAPLSTIYIVRFFMYQTLIWFVNGTKPGTVLIETVLSRKSLYLVFGFFKAFTKLKFVVKW